MVVSSCIHFVGEDRIVLFVTFIGIFISSGYQSLISCIVYKYFLLFCPLTLHYIEGFLCNEEISLFTVFPFAFAFVLLLVSYKKSLPMTVFAGFPLSVFI